MAHQFLIVHYPRTPLLKRSSSSGAHRAIRSGLGDHLQVTFSRTPSPVANPVTVILADPYPPYLGCIYSGGVSPTSSLSRAMTCSGLPATSNEIGTAQPCPSVDPPLTLGGPGSFAAAPTTRSSGGD